MDNSKSYFSVVIITDYTTVHPTYSVVVVTEYTTVHPTNVLTTNESPRTSLISTPANTPHISLIETSISAPHSSLISTTTSSRIMSAGASASTVPPVPIEPLETGGQKFDDTFAYVVLTLIVLVAVLLLTMLISMVYLRWRGKCPDCQTMRKQLEKWESGEQKPITPAAVRQREAFNKSSSQAMAPAELDLERGDMGDAGQVSSASFLNLKANNRPCVRRMLTRKPVPNTGAFAGVAKDAAYNDIGGSFRVRSNPPQIYYEPSTINTPNTPNTYRDSVYWPEFKSAGTQQVGGRESRVFADVQVCPPKHYAAYVTDEDDLTYPDMREQDILDAEAAIQSEEYKRAEAIMKRASAPESILRRATSIVNLVDQRLNIARNPSMYPEFCRAEEAECAKNDPKEYHTTEWRKRGSKAADTDDELYRNP